MSKLKLFYQRQKHAHFIIHVHSMNILTIAILFLSTSVDDLVILHTWFTKKIPGSTIFLGQLIGISLLVLSSLLLAQGIIQVTGDNIKRLSLGGLIPIILGIREILDAKKPHNTKSNQKSPILFQIIGTTLANGSDNIVLYTPFFVKLSYSQYRELGIVFFVMTLLWCTIAKYTSSFTILHRFTPYLLIGIGVYILKDLL